MTILSKHDHLNRPRLHCLGFMFSPDCKQVALIEKISPAWQAGKLNGIGGKAEPGETSLEAMAREFREETGVATETTQWTLFAALGSPHFEVHVFRCFDPRVSQCHTTTAEQVHLFNPRAPELCEFALDGVCALLLSAMSPSSAFTRIDYDEWAEESIADMLHLRQA